MGVWRRSGVSAPWWANRLRRVEDRGWGGGQWGSMEDRVGLESMKGRIIHTPCLALKSAAEASHVRLDWMRAAYLQ